jgi:hypothetical protein
MHPVVSKYENRNIIIVKINDDGGHQFKSGTNRFKSIEIGGVGPGSCTFLGMQMSRKCLDGRREVQL